MLEKILNWLCGPVKPESPRPGRLVRCAGCTQPFDVDRAIVVTPGLPGIAPRYYHSAECLPPIIAPVHR